VQWRVFLCFLLAACSESSVQVVEDGGPTRVALDQANVRVVTGDDQEGTVAAVLPRPLIVEVVDALGDPLSSAPVRWSFGAGRGLAKGRPAARSFVTTTTDASGRATVDWQLGTKSGEQTAWVEVDPSGSTSDPAVALRNASGKRVAFRAHGKAAEPAEILVSHAQLEVSEGEEVEITAVVVDRYGNDVEGAEVTFTSSDESVVTVQSSTDAAATELSMSSVVSADHPSGEGSTDLFSPPSLAVRTAAAAWDFLDAFRDLIQ
jgi:hypothetical protein